MPARPALMRPARSRSAPVAVATASASGGASTPAGDPEADGGNAARPFRYRDLGSAAYISRGRAAVAAGRLHFSGFLGWLAWLFIHIAFLTGYRNRAARY